MRPRWELVAQDGDLSLVMYPKDVVGIFVQHVRQLCRIFILNAWYRSPTMPYRNREWDFHLTPVGWTANDITSAYTAETWRLSFYQEFAWSKEQYAWRRIWHN